MLNRIAQLPEIWFTAAIAALVVLLSIGLGLPISLPSGERAAFVGIHYLYPLLGVGLWSLFAFFGLRQRLASTFMVALPCYAIVLVCHFNLKLWLPHINPVLWDGLYWNIDQALRPLVVACFELRRWIAPAIPLDSNFYMAGFIVMFYVSFSYHALRTPQAFRPLFLAALIFQGLGALAYMLAPALGPFLYEQGVEALQTRAQAGMLQAYRENVAGGSAWLSENGSANIAVGLAAMPSLHTGGSFLFLLFAWRHGRPLVPAYSLLFGFIAIDAVANRWHYLVDLPAGIALALFSAWLADRMSRDALTSELGARIPSGSPIPRRPAFAFRRIGRSGGLRVN